MHEATWIKRYISPLVTAAGAEDLRDDVALLSSQDPTIVTMDTLVEGVHFLPKDPLNTVGQKLIRVNVSDIYAKAAQPIEALLSIAWSRARPEADFEALVEGIGRDLQTYDVSLIGGDLVSIDGPLTLTLTLTGRCFNSAPVRRTGGRAGQGLYLDGEIGWGGLGLDAARTGSDPKTAQRYRVPHISPLDAAQAVARYGSASMDVSDGLLIDATRLAAASECGVLIALDRVPLAKPTTELEFVLAQCASGDDYRILMSADTNSEIEGFTKIGNLTESKGLQLTYCGQRINPPSTLGFEH
ncbi:MAG: thiamine-phosphate kinase [Pseudomonadota bacterium]